MKMTNFLVQHNLPLSIADDPGPLFRNILTLCFALFSIIPLPSNELQIIKNAQEKNKTHTSTSKAIKKVNGNCIFTIGTIIKCGAIALFSMQVVFVLPLAYALAIWLSVKILRNTAVPDHQQWITVGYAELKSLSSSLLLEQP